MSGCTCGKDAQIAAMRQTIAAFQRDKERYLQVQFAVDMKQSKLKAEIRELQRQNDLLRKELGR